MLNHSRQSLPRRPRRRTRQIRLFHPCSRRFAPQTRRSKMGRRRRGRGAGRSSPLRRVDWLTSRQDDWDASEDEKPKAAPAGTVAPARKKMTLKQKLAEKERLAAEAVSLYTACPYLDSRLISPSLVERERRGRGRLDRDDDGAGEAADSEGEGDRGGLGVRRRTHGSHRRGRW